MRLLLVAFAVIQAAALAGPLAGAIAYLLTRGTCDQQRAAIHAALQAL